MACARHQALYIDAVHTKCSLGFAAAALIGGSHFVGMCHGAHAAPAATANGFDHDAAGTIGLLAGKEVLRLLQRHGFGAAGHQRHAALLRQRAGSGLVAQQRQLLWRGADKAHARCRAGGGELGVLAQKTITGVQGIAAMLTRNLQQMRTIQIGRRAADIECHGFISCGHMRGRRIVLRIDGQAGNAQLLQRTNNAQRDFAAIGDQDFFKHRTLALTLVLIAASALLI